MFLARECQQDVASAIPPREIDARSTCERSVGVECALGESTVAWDLYWARVDPHPHDTSHLYRFCPQCGGALERRRLKATEPERPVCTQCGFVFYLDPKIAVGTIIATDANRIVLVRRAIEPGYGKWVFPGGYVDRGEA